MSSIALANPWEVRFDADAAHRALELGADVWSRSRKAVAVFLISALAAAFLPHLAREVLSAATSTGSAPAAAMADGLHTSSAPTAAPRAAYGSLPTLQPSGPTADARLTGSLGAGGALAVATKAPATPNCGGSVKSTLASSGYQPPRLAETTPGATVASIQKAIGAACDAGVPAPQVAAQTLKNANYGATTIASFLASGFGQSAAGAAGVLKAVGFGATEVASALLGVFQLTATEAASLLKSLAYTVEQVAAALQSAYALAAEAAATVLKAVGYLANEIATALQAVFALTAQGTAAVLRAIGVAVNENAGALQTVFGLGAEAAAGILKAIGVAVNEIAGALQTVFGLGA
ncbi:MAG: hypothetical protein QOE93_2388, partial [Actinomycetota bacterium]|nr:hypothetical protein [Actinomycetota bacterium]